MHCCSADAAASEAWNNGLVFVQGLDCCTLHAAWSKTAGEWQFGVQAQDMDTPPVDAATDYSLVKEKQDLPAVLVWGV